MGSVTSLADRKRDATLWTPEQALDDALHDVQIGNIKATKVLIVFLDDSEGKFDPAFTQSGMSASECLALLEVGKLLFYKEMGL